MNKCEKEFYDYEIKNKRWICPKCGFEIKSNRKKHLHYCDGTGPRRLKYSNPSKRGSTEFREKISNSIKEKYKNDLEWKESVRQSIINSYKNGTSTGEPKTEEGKIKKREKIRNKALERYRNGWEVKCGRCKKINYESPIAGKIKVDGSWELKYAQYLDSIGVIWERNKKRFPYLNLKKEYSTYCPDFWVEDWNTYIEIKGYETELDRCKWSQFKEPLIVIRKKEMKQLKLL